MQFEGKRNVTRNTRMVGLVILLVTTLYARSLRDDGAKGY